MRLIFFTIWVRFSAENPQNPKITRKSLFTYGKTIGPDLLGQIWAQRTRFWIWSIFYSEIQKIFNIAEKQLFLIGMACKLVFRKPDAKLFVWDAQIGQKRPFFWVFSNFGQFWPYLKTSKSRWYIRPKRPFLLRILKGDIQKSLWVGRTQS